jgi:hypothetical protein
LAPGTGWTSASLGPVRVALTPSGKLNKPQVRLILVTAAGAGEADADTHDRSDVDPV